MPFDEIKTHFNESIVGLKGSLKKQQILITDREIRCNDQTILCKQITALRYGSMLLRVNGIKASKNYRFDFKTQNGTTLSFLSDIVFPYGKRLAAADATYVRLIKAVWLVVENRLKEEFYQQLLRGQEILVGKCTVTPHGIFIKRRLLRNFFKTKTFFIPWNECLQKSANGRLYLFSTKYKYVKTQLAYLKVWNANVLQGLLDFLWEDGNAYALSEHAKENTHTQMGR